MPSDALLAAVHAMTALTDQMRSSPLSADQRRELLRSRPGPAPDPGTSVESTRIGGVPAELVWTSHSRDTHTILYLHGGGFTTGSPARCRQFAGRLSRATGARVMVLDYRLAPEHPFPAALEDAVNGYLGLLADSDTGSEIVVGGDSAGGGLAISALVASRERGMAMPSAMFALSPSTDLSLSSPSVHDPDFPDPLIPAGAHEIREMYQAYLAGHDPRDAAVSPVYADLTGLPPLHLEAGGAERLLDDSRHLVTRAQECGVSATLEVTEGAMHNFVFAASDAPETSAAIDRVAAHITAASSAARIEKGA